MGMNPPSEPNAKQKADVNKPQDVATMMQGSAVQDVAAGVTPARVRILSG
jgi:hypothetical protein